MNRRELMLLSAGAVIAPRALRAPCAALSNSETDPTWPSLSPVIGYLNGTSPSLAEPLLAAFRQGLSEAGYVEGQNLAIEYRWAECRYDRLPTLAADLVDRNVDPVGNDLVASLARPGGNLTGGRSAGLAPLRIFPA